MTYFTFTLQFRRSPIACALGLAFLFALATPAYIAAQGCALICNDTIVVAVPANGTTELLPSDLSEGNLSQICPNGILNAQAQINISWQPASGNMVFNESHIGQTILCRIFDQVTTNSCWGDVQIVAAPPSSDTIHFQLCSELWKNNRPIKGTTLIFQPINPAFPYSPTVFVLDSSQSCADVSVVLSDYLPGTTFGYSAAMPADTNYTNGITSLDMCLISQHILGLEPLEPFYALFAADANRSGSLTTFDIVEIRKLIIGVYSQLPNNTSWLMLPDYCQFPNPSNPFSGTCPPEISPAQLAAMDGDTAKVIGVKIGDVDGDASLNGEPYFPPVVADSVGLALPLGPILANIPTTVPVRLDEDFDLSSLQVHFFLDPNLAQYDSITSGEINVFPSNINSNPATGDLVFLSFSVPATFVPAGTPLFYIHLKATQNANLENILRVLPNDMAPFTIATGEDCGNYYKINPVYANFVASHSPKSGGLRVQPPSPNPFEDRAFLEIELESAEMAVLEVVDLTGRIVFSEEKNLSSGANRWEIPASAVAPGSFSIWRLRVGTQMASGKIARK